MQSSQGGPWLWRTDFRRAVMGFGLVRKGEGWVFQLYRHVKWRKGQGLRKGGAFSLSSCPHFQERKDL